MDDNSLLGGFGSALADSKRMIDDFMNELKRKPLSSNLLYTTLMNKLMDLKNKREKYIVNRLHSSESERLAECSLFNDDDYMDFDESSVVSTAVSYEIVIPVFIKMLEENKGKLQDASRVDFIRLIQRIVNDIINRGDGYEVKRWGNKKGERNKWKRVDEDEEDNDDLMKPRAKKNLRSERGRVDEDEEDNDDSMKPRAKKNLRSERGRVDEDEEDNDDSMKPRAQKNLRSKKSTEQNERVNLTYDVKQQVLADDRKKSANENPPTTHQYYYFQGVVYFLTIHVPAEIVQYLTQHQLLQINLFGVKVGQSKMDLWQFWKKMLFILSFHPKLRAYWVCIGVPIGMYSLVIEQYVHFMHPRLHLNSEWWEHSILEFVPTILKLFNTHIISLGKYTIGKFSNKAAGKKKSEDEYTQLNLIWMTHYVLIWLNC
jgi:hypothetical protein